MQNHALSTSIKPGFSATLINYHSAFFYKVKKNGRCKQPNNMHLFDSFFLSHFLGKRISTKPTAPLICLRSSFLMPDFNLRLVVDVSMCQWVKASSNETFGVLWRGLVTKNIQQNPIQHHGTRIWMTLGLIISTLQPFISKQLASIEGPCWELQEGASHVREIHGLRGLCKLTWDVSIGLGSKGPRWKHH